MAQRVMRAILILSLSALAACGSSGGGSGGGDSLNGTYSWVAIGGDSDPSDVAISIFGDVDANGRGSANRFALQNFLGLIVAPPATELTYSVAADGQLSFGNGDPTVGGVGSNGRAALLTLNPGSPLLGVLLRRGGGTVADDLNGLYHCGGFSFEPASSVNESTGGDAEFTSGAAISFTGDFVNFEGTVVVPAPALESFLLSPGGVIRVTDEAGVTLEGGVAADGEMIVLGGGNEQDDRVAFRVYMRHSVGATKASLSGPYWAAGFTNEASPGVQFLSFFGTATFDDGNVEFTTASNLEGSTFPPNTFSTTYDVEGDGKLTIDLVGALQGGVSPSGAYAFAVGGTGQTELTAVVMFVRK